MQISAQQLWYRCSTAFVSHAVVPIVCLSKTVAFYYIARRPATIFHESASWSLQLLLDIRYMQTRIRLPLPSYPIFPRGKHGTSDPRNTPNISRCACTFSH